MVIIVLQKNANIFMAFVLVQMDTLTSMGVFVDVIKQQFIYQKQKLIYQNLQLRQH